MHLSIPSWFLPIATLDLPHPDPHCLHAACGHIPHGRPLLLQTLVSQSPQHRLLLVFLLPRQTLLALLHFLPFLYSPWKAWVPRSSDLSFIKSFFRWFTDPYRFKEGICSKDAHTWQLFFFFCSFSWCFKINFFYFWKIYLNVTIIIEINFSWSTVDVQCVNFCSTAKCFSYTHIHLLFFHILFHYGLS